MKSDRYVCTMNNYTTRVIAARVRYVVRSDRTADSSDRLIRATESIRPRAGVRRATSWRARGPADRNGVGSRSGETPAPGIEPAVDGRTFRIRPREPVLSC
jgi:hypothetical protein